MKDQAERLRNIMESLKKENETAATAVLEKPSQEPPQKHARVITVTSGKGGVGKTSFAVNAAIALSEMGYRTVIMDADFGFANIDILLGVIPRYTLLDMLYNGKSITDILCDGPQNIKFIPGGSGIEELAKAEKDKVQYFVESMKELDNMADFILVDTGAGLNEAVSSFVLAADDVILVTTPEPTAITDAYALVKMITAKDRNKSIKIVVNKAESREEAEKILERLHTVSQRFLQVELEKLGYIYNDEAVKKSVKLQQPLIISFPRSIASRHVREITLKIVENDGSQSQYGGGIKGFFNRLVKFMNG